MPDGQLTSHAIRAYLNQNITLSQNPRLRLLRSHAVTPPGVGEAKEESPGLVAPNQQWVEVVNGQQVTRSGTLLLFDLSQIDFQYKATLRVTPGCSGTKAAPEALPS